jgi:hypothetical protein
MQVKRSAGTKTASFHAWSPLGVRHAANGKSLQIASLAKRINVLELRPVSGVIAA